MRLFIFFILLQLSFFSGLLAQADIYCTTPGDPSDPGWVDWLKNENETGPFFIKLKFHSNETDVTEELIQEAVDKLGLTFNPENIFFGWDCTIHENIPGTQGGNPPDPTVMNVEVIGGSYGSGYAIGGAPGTAVQVTTPGLLGNTFRHELGHAFGLHHVFKKNEGGANGYGCSELVSRTNGNCDECGDCLCDTDATPTPSTSNFNFNTCNFVGYTPFNNAANYDANGDRYNPGPMTDENIMNYSRDIILGIDCAAVFTPQQTNRMRNMLANAEKLSQLMHKDDPNVFMTDVHRIIENATYPDCDDGTISIGVVGGYGPFSYEWSNGETTQNLTGLGEGVYCVTVTDACCNTITHCAPIECQCFPAIIETQFNANGTNTTKDLAVLFPNSTGMAFPITVTLSNATPSVTINFPEPIYFEDLEIGGYYCLTFTDNNGCTFDKCFVVEGETCPEVFAVSLDRLGHDVDCRPEGDGFIKIDVDANLENCRYDITWNTVPEQTGAVARNLEPGTYCAFIEGKKNSSCQGCLTVMCWDIGETVTDPLPIEVEYSFRDWCWEDDFGIQHWSGALSLEITGGAGSYSFDWDIDPISYNTNGGTHNFILNQEGTYCVTITDECGGEKEFCYTVKWKRYIEVDHGDYISLEIRRCFSRAKKPEDGFAGSNQFSIAAYPNPFSHEINIYVTALENEEGELIVLNAMGKPIFKKQVALNSGENILTISELTAQATGLYFIQIANSSQKETVKVLKTN